MTLEFDNYVSDEELATAAEFYDDLEFELDNLELEIESSLEAFEEETRLADAEWNEHWQQLGEELPADDQFDDNGNLVVW